MDSIVDYLDESTLFRALKGGHNSAFEFIFKTYYPRLQGYALRFISDREVVKDILQECFITLWEKHESVQYVSIHSLLFVMVRNSCLNYLKHSSVVNQYQIEYIANIKGEERLYHSDFLCEAEYPLLYEELQKEIKQVIDRLPEKCREVFLMSRFDGLKNREIAEKLQVSNTAIEKHIAKAIERFETHFKNKYPVDIFDLVITWLISSNM